MGDIVRKDKDYQLINCENCNGTGRIADQKCSKCHGTGRVKQLNG
jgi:DnaJ-class molecular chaperone